MGKRFYAVVLPFFFLCSASAQVTDKKIPGDGESNIFTKMEIEANTTPKAWAEHVRRNTQLPDSLLKEIPPGTYKITVQFIVDKHGNIGQVKAKNDPGYGLAKRAEKIILNYKGTWQPASQCGRNVNAYKQEAIIFIIPGI